MSTLLDPLSKCASFFLPGCLIKHTSTILIFQVQPQLQALLWPLGRLYSETACTRVEQYGTVNTDPFNIVDLQNHAWRLVIIMVLEKKKVQCSLHAQSLVMRKVYRKKHELFNDTNCFVLVVFLIATLIERSRLNILKIQRIVVMWLFSYFKTWRWLEKWLERL